MKNTSGKYGLCAIVEEQDCTGCSACMNVCPKGAITMEENPIGHILPFIHEYKCVDCNLCRKVCPSIDNLSLLNPIQKVYAAWARNKEEHASSTSGGVSAVASLNVILNGGGVYGCASLPGCQFEHVRINNLEDLQKIKGSKYVQSNIGMIFKSVKEDLKTGKKVLFTGTPCQIAGLKKYLCKDYSNLYTIDLVCHGVPSQKLLKEHIKYVGFSLYDIDRVSFREGGCLLALWKNGSCLYIKDDMHDLFYSGFYDSLFLRESCVNCKYSLSKRPGDLTMGDFRKLGREIPFSEKTDGNISLLTVNTKKGSVFLEEIKSNLYIYERSLGEAIKGNPQLCHPSVRKSNYQTFKRLYAKYGYGRACKQTMVMRLIKNFILSLMYKLRQQ